MHLFFRRHNSIHAHIFAEGFRNEDKSFSAWKGLRAHFHSQRKKTSVQGWIPVSSWSLSSPHPFLLPPAQVPPWRRPVPGLSPLTSSCSRPRAGTPSGSFCGPSSARRTCSSGWRVRSWRKKRIKPWLKRKRGSYTKTTFLFSLLRR